MITMALGGLWHGASWNYVLWGIYHGLFLAIERALGIGRKDNYIDEINNSDTFSRFLYFLKSSARWIVCQYLVLLSWPIFRVKDTNDIFYCIKKFIFFDFDFNLASFGIGNFNPFSVVIILIIFFLFHFLSFRIGGLSDAIDRQSRLRQFVIFSSAILMLIFFWPSERAAFIYFQF